MMFLEVYEWHCSCWRLLLYGIVFSLRYFLRFFSLAFNVVGSSPLLRLPWPDLLDPDLCLSFPFQSVPSNEELFSRKWEMLKVGA